MCTVRKRRAPGPKEEAADEGGSVRSGVEKEWRRGEEAGHDARNENIYHTSREQGHAKIAMNQKEWAEDVESARYERMTTCVVEEMMHVA